MGDVIPVNAARYGAALAELEALMLAGNRSHAENDRMELLAACIGHYEGRTFPLQIPLAADAISFRMSEGRLSGRDVGKHVGGPARLRRILGGAAALNVDDVRALHQVFGIPLLPLVFGGEDWRWHHD